MTNTFVLFYEFFKIGLFAVGGGLATLPFLYNLADKYNWFTSAMIMDMIAISESTPGPIGVNMATYTGFQNMGVWGGIITTIGLVTPSVIVIIIISNFLKKFRQNKHVNDIFYTLRPTVTGMIGAAGFGIITNCIFNRSALTEGNWIGFIRPKEIALFLVVFIVSNKIKIHPIFYIILAGVIGVIFKF